MKRSRSDNTVTVALSRAGVKKRRPMHTPSRDWRRRRYLRMNRRTGGLMQLEQKFYDTSVVDAPILYPTNCAGLEVDPTTVNCISAPAQGSGDTQRVGRQITIRRIDVAGVFNIQSATAQTTINDHNPICVVYLVLDKQTNGAQLSSEDVLKNQAADVGANSALMRNISNTHRFQVLGKRVLHMQSMTAVNNSSAGTISHTGDYLQWAFHKKCNIPVRFGVGLTSAGVASVEDNSLHIIAVTNSSTHNIIMTYNARIRYTDV